MFQELPAPMLDVMDRLESRDAQDREDGTGKYERLRQVPRETGRFIAVLAALAPAAEWIEIGTSAGYSTLWLSRACRERGQRLRTYEILAAKAALARETFAAAGVGDVIELVEGDFLAHADQLGPIGFCFLDAEKEVYSACYDVVVPLLVPGGVLVADNAISHQSELQPVIDRALADSRVDALVVPIGTGELLCRKR